MLLRSVHVQEGGGIQDGVTVRFQGPVVITPPLVFQLSERFDAERPFALARRPTQGDKIG
jgi:hypothetical protein